MQYAFKSKLFAVEQVFATSSEVALANPVDSSLSTDDISLILPCSSCLSAITSFWSFHYVLESHRGVPHSVMSLWRGRAGVYIYLYLLRITPCLVSELRTTHSG